MHIAFLILVLLFRYCVLYVVCASFEVVVERMERRRGGMKTGGDGVD